MNIFLLKGKLIENQKTYVDCAKELNISTSTFSDKINGKVEFKIKEAVQLSKFLNLNDEEYLKIFFN